MLSRPDSSQAERLEVWIADRPGGGGAIVDVDASGAVDARGADDVRGEGTGGGDAAQLTQRDNRVGSVLNRVERRDRVEPVVVPGQLLQVALVKLSIPVPFSGDRQHARRGVDPSDLGAATGRNLQRQPGSAAGVEQPGAAPGAEFVVHLLEERAGDRLECLGPHPRLGTPQRALNLR